MRFHCCPELYAHQSREAAKTFATPKKISHPHRIGSTNEKLSDYLTSRFPIIRPHGETPTVLCSGLFCLSGQR